MMTVQARPESQKILGIHHHAFKCRDAEETRHFYEDILGLPMTAAIVMPDNPLTGEKNPFCHIFFELGDGNSVAFFDYPVVHAGKSFEAVDGFDHHVALKVPDEETLRSLERRLQDAGVKTMFFDHEVFHSVYFNDPNGLNLEIVCDTALTA